MTKRSLIIGMGFGQLYKRVLTELGHEVITVDPDLSKGADYATFDSVPKGTEFDTANICTPNYTHASIARMVAPFCKIVCVEKPGVETAIEWAKLSAEFPDTRFMMAKNNQYRDNIAEMQELYKTSAEVNLHWINHNRVPNAGTWFTTKQLAFGGVSRDLLPHLLSLFIVMDSQWRSTTWDIKEAFQSWHLGDLTNTDYGTVDPNGTYDVDDYVKLVSYRLAGDSGPGRHVRVVADWKAGCGDEIGIYFDDEFIPLGLCPESAYKTMMETAIVNVDNDMFWGDQYRQDMWIHSNIAI